MINTIFYFPESLTFDQYLDALNSNTDDGIASRTIVFAKQQGKIYNNGKIYGTTYSDVQNLIEQNRYNDEYVREAISNLERDLQQNSEAIDLQGQQYLAINQRLSKIETNGYVSESQMLSAIAGELDGSTQKSSVRNKVNNVAKEASAALFTEVSDQNDNITAQSIVNAITSNSTAKANLASSFNSGDNTMWANVVTQTDLNSATSALYAALQDKANDSEVVKKASIIASINSSGESNVRINADKIQLDGTVIAERLMAAQAVLGGFSISQDELSGVYTYETQNGPHLTHHTNKITLSPQGFSTTEVNGVGYNITNQILTDGSGFLACGALNWDAKGALTINGSNNNNGKVNINGLLYLLDDHDSWQESLTVKPTGLEYYNGDDNVTNGISLTNGLVVTGDIATVTADGFIKNGSSNDYVLLAGGGTKALSEFSSGGGSGNYLPLTGGQLTGDLTLYNSDAQVVNVAGKTSDTTSLGGGSITIETATTGTPLKAKSYLDHDQLYFSNQDVKGTSITYNSVTSGSFIKSGGTSSQFLKADGSVDSNTYLPVVNGTVSVSPGNMDVYSSGQPGDITTVFDAKSSQEVVFAGGSTYYFDNSVQAGSFVKLNATSDEVLMADGSTMTLAELKAALNAI